MLPIRTILHPTDFSEYSGYAFQLACDLARDYDARLIVLHVAAPPVVVYGEGVLPPEPKDYKERLRERLQQVVIQDPKIPIEHRLIEGDAAREILRLAGEAKCNLIVMGTHGRTGLGRLLMGSVAEQVVRKAPCPVLTVKIPQRQLSPGEEAIPTMAEAAASGER
ncbi:MAG TPA: universal stress protein [Chloroflexota bacterium]|jgi:nucleotide-binding universal stress UspA family protein|nr:universal stress protein [Chloroflexota bacterium]